MKNPHVLLVITFLLVILQTPLSLMAQNAFDVKKKNTAVNTSSLGAAKIRGSAAKNTAGRGGSAAMGQPKAFQKPFIQKKHSGVFYSPETGLPSFINSAQDNSTAPFITKQDIRTSCADYLQKLKPLLQIERSDVSFSIRQIKTDPNNKTRVRLDQHYKNIPVNGAEVVVHLSSSGEGESFNGTYYNIEENIDVVPAVSEQAALEKVNSHLAGRTPLRPLNEMERKLVQYEQPQVALCIYQEKSLVKTFLLAYHIVSCPSIQQRWEYFIDAVTGNILHQYETTCFVDGPKTASALDLNGFSQSINTYLVGTIHFMVDASRPMFNATTSVLPDEPVGGIFTIDMNNTFGENTSVRHFTSANNTWNNPSSVSAHFNAGIAYEYFRTKHNRNSIDDSGGTIYSVVNVPDRETGQPLDNAFWNGKLMSYGNGNVAFKPLAGGLDVAGHEMTHGVVQNTANLEYQGESGAINESMADIFGSMMDPDDWDIGEDVVKLSAFPSGAMRSMSDPHNGGSSLADPGFQPKHTSEAYHGNEDNGGVHINSGIPNNAFYRYAEAITRDKAAAVFYKALNDYLTKSSKFIDLRLAVVKAAGDLYGTSSNEVTQAGIAFDAVGISTGTGGNYNETLPGNPGTEFLLIYNTDTADPNTLYRTPPDASAFVALSTTTFLSRPSITDDGTTAVFVGSDNKIRAINTAPGTTPNEVIIQNEAIWSNVVVSKGGTKLAAVTTAQDGIIYVYDIASASWMEFELYNPTYSEGVTSGGPVYADALEWDYNGEILVYDCFNRIQNSTGVDIEYWDVNFIRVWDNAANDFGDGTIAKLFSSLPDGVSIGNPSFSKNSPNVIAFDYADFVDGEYAVLGSNIETSEVNVIASNTGLGYPTFNKNDSHIAFTSLNGTQQNIDHVTLNSDKISANGSPLGFIIDAKWPVYFATGDRQTGECIAPPTPTISTNGNTATPTLTSSAPSGNQWFLNGTAIPGATGNTLNVTEDGIYTVRATVSGCPSAFSADFQIVVTGISEQTKKQMSMNCYPTFFINEVSVVLDQQIMTDNRVELVNTMGQKVYTYTTSPSSEDTMVLNLENVKAGYYVLRISNAKKSGVCRLVKN